MMWFHHGYGMPWFAFGGWGLVGGLLGLLLVAGLIAGLAIVAVWLWRRATEPTRGGPLAPTSALEALSVRYARGEIGRDEFRRLREELGGPQA